MMKMATCFTTAALVLAVPAFGATVSLEADADTYLPGLTPDTPGGTDADNELILGSNAAPYNGLVRFDDFSSLGLGAGETVVVNSVTLTLSNRTGGSQGGTGVYGLTLSDYGFNFVENVATFNDPDGDGSNATGDTTAGGTAGTSLSTAASTGNGAGLTATFGTSAAFAADVQTAINSGGSLNYLITTDATGQNFVRFADNNTTTAAGPSLNIDYTVVPEPGSLALLGLGGLLVARRRRG